MIEYQSLIKADSSLLRPMDDLSVANRFLMIAFGQKRPLLREVGSQNPSSQWQIIHSK